MSSKPSLCVRLGSLMPAHADAGKSGKTMARGGQGRGQALPREMAGEPLDLLDAGTSRKLVKHAAARHAPSAAAAGAGDDQDDFEHGADGKIIVRVWQRFCCCCCCCCSVNALAT